ncbi:MAG: DUF192 domain-containing protein [bacterium]
MFVLLNGSVIAEKAEKAEGFFRRAKGLIGRKKFDEGCCFVIPRCNAVHTFFMSFSMDAAAVNKENRVIAVKKRIKPWSVFIARGGSCIYEFPQDFTEKKNIKKGDILSLNEKE